MGSDCEYSCQPQTHEGTCEINIWDLIEGLMMINDNQNVKEMLRKFKPIGKG